MFIICLRVNERRFVVQGTSRGRSIEAERNEDAFYCDNALSVNRLLDEVCSDEYTYIVKLNFWETSNISLTRSMKFMKIWIDGGLK